jgi:hypothetical protein
MVLRCEVVCVCTLPRLSFLKQVRGVSSLIRGRAAAAVITKATRMPRIGVKRIVIHMIVFYMESIAGLIEGKARKKGVSGVVMMCLLASSHSFALTTGINNGTTRKAHTERDAAEGG